jgi:hypothetical protein
MEAKNKIKKMYSDKIYCEAGGRILPELSAGKLQMPGQLPTLSG